jgi:hypothetical protein
MSGPLHLEVDPADLLTSEIQNTAPDLQNQTVCWAHRQFLKKQSSGKILYKGPESEFSRF